MSTLCLEKDNQFYSVCYLWFLRELDISVRDDSGINAVTLHEGIKELTEIEKGQFEAVLDQYQDIFTSSNMDLDAPRMGFTM